MESQTICWPAFPISPVLQGIMIGTRALERMLKIISYLGGYPHERQGEHRSCHDLWRIGASSSLGMGRCVSLRCCGASSNLEQQRGKLCQCTHVSMFLTLVQRLRRIQVSIQRQSMALKGSICKLYALTISGLKHI